MSAIKHAIETVTDQAVKTLLWSECTEHGDSLSDLYAIDHISESVINELREDVMNFLDMVWDHEDAELSARLWTLANADLEQFGHDFILSRNGHGTGFWDRGNGEVGDALHEMAKSFGSFHLYAGDDGFLYN